MTIQAPKKIVCAFGTRPEAIKMAPVYRALAADSRFAPLVLLTGQHREQLQQALDLFDLPVAENLDVMTQRQTLPELAARVLPQAAAALKRLGADYVLVHGDTLTTFVVAWAAFMERIPIGHVEAGLRSFDLAEPFPEEANRRLTDVLADLYLAPTGLSKTNLLREGADGNRIVVTGQTGIDAVLHASALGRRPDLIPSGPTVTITMHRRENWTMLEAMAGALHRVAQQHPEMLFVYPMHLNPVVREAVIPALSGMANVLLIDPLEYGAMSRLIAESTLLITDSGGLQEEGAALHVPVVVLRNVTERPEGVEAGCIRLAGVEPEHIYLTVTKLLDSPAELNAMRQATNPYGDGFASQRVAKAIAWRLCGDARPIDWMR